ncbi:hypothetical protein OG896_24980 [Streptomyces sp. NBC_00669]|uniref:hypothetical protein n=1 Tax=Streptomyces sp. NBC_00669 TaxID=2976011 RepID=UPI002E371AEA|nr:hypothetical protein [Streptomyces sp. NBC_00669]
MTVQTLAVEEAALAAIEEQITARLAAVRARRTAVHTELQKELVSTGVKSADVLAGTRKLAVVSRSEAPAPKAKVTDKAKLARWAEKYVPHNVTVEPTLRPAYEKVLLRDLTMAGSTRILLDGRSRPLTVPGVELASSRGASHSMRGLDAAAVAEAWQVGALDHVESLSTLPGAAEALHALATSVEGAVA